MEKKNKLSDVVKQIITSNKIDSEKSITNDSWSPEKYWLGGSILKNDIIGKLLFSCEEFSEVESIEIVDNPAFPLDGNAILTDTITLSEDTKFKGKIYIYSIQLSHENFDMNSLMDDSMDNILLTPCIYNPQTFTPKKGITLFFSPEAAQDMSVPVCIYTNNGYKIDVDRFKENMHKLLDKALQNPEEYKAKGFRKIMIRGYFPEKITSSNNTIKVII